MQHHKYSLDEVDSMIPWEKDVYINMLVGFLKEEKAKAEQWQHSQK